MPSADERSISGEPVFASEHVQRELRNLDVVHAPRLRKDHLQLACGVAQQRETCAHNLPFLFRIACRRKLANSGEGGFEAGNSGQACNQIEEPCFLRFALLGKTETDVDLLAEAAVAGDQQSRQGEACLTRLLQRFCGAKRRSWKFGQLCEFLVQRARALLAGESRQFHSLFARARDSV